MQDPSRSTRPEAHTLRRHYGYLTDASECSGFSAALIFGGTMNDSRIPARLPCDGHFHARVNDKRFITRHLSGSVCLRCELTGPRTHRIWKIHAVGTVSWRRTVIGLFIDQSLRPGTYDLIGSDRLTAVYHLTPRRIAQVYHSRDFQQGSVTLLECNVDTGRLRGTFEFAMSAIGFRVSGGEFDLGCDREKS